MAIQHGLLKEMEIRVSKKTGPAILEDVKIVFRNFAGKEGKYNKAGDRNFAVLLDKDIAEQMLADGWNVKFLEPRDPEDDRQAYLQVTVGFAVRPPSVFTVTSRGKTRLDEDVIEILDWADILKADISLNPYHWEVSGKTGVKAYLKSLYITLREDELDMKYYDVPDSAQSVLADAEDPWDTDAK